MGELVFGDCIGGMRHLADESVDAVVTDPPYGYGIGGKSWDTFSKLDEFEGMTSAWAEQSLRVLRTGGLMAVFGAPRTIHRVGMAMERSGGVVLDMVAWLFGNGAGINVKNGRLKPGYEPILLVGKAANTRLNVDARRIQSAHQPDRAATNVLLDESAAQELDQRAGRRTSGARRPGVRKSIGMMRGSTGDASPPIVGSAGSASRYFYVARDRGNQDRPDHVVVKPLPVMVWLVGLVASPGQLVLDPFIGTGTTALAAMECGCDWLGFENDRRTYDLARLRIAQAGAVQTSMFGPAQSG